MKFEKIEDKVQLGQRGYIRHRLCDLPESELIQKCVLCGEIINNYSPQNGWVRLVNDNNSEKGMASGYVYVSIERNPSMIIHERMADLGANMPTDFIDCTVINS